MSQYLVSEDQVKKALQIDSFRNLSKDKIMEFASLIPHMDKDVAIAIINQFPAYAESSRNMIEQYNVMCDKVLQSNDDSRRDAVMAYKTILDDLNEAINAGKKVSFLYFKYDVRKEPKLRNEGKPFVFSPHRLVWNGDFYYMVGVFDNGKRVGTFRLDRIMKRPVVLNETALPFPADFDFNKHLQVSFRMFGTQHQTIDLICSNDVMDAILDKFGMDVTTYAYDMEHFRAEVEVVPSKVFFSWIFGFEGKVVINAPADVKDAYRDMVLKATEII